MMQIITSIEQKETVPGKSTRKAVVVTIQGFSVLGTLELLVTCLTNLGVFEYLHVNIDTVHGIIPYLVIPITGILHGLIKWIGHKTGYTINIPGLVKMALFILVCFSLISCATNGMIVTEQTGPDQSLRVRQFTISTWGTHTQEGQGQFDYKGTNDTFDMRAGGSVRDQETIDPLDE